MPKTSIPVDCKGNEIKIGDYIEGVMSELWIMKICGKVIDIKFTDFNEAYGCLEGQEGYWHLRQFILKRTL